MTVHAPEGPLAVAVSGGAAEQCLRAARVSAVREEKALHIARSLERRARRGGSRSVLFLAEARRLRKNAAAHAAEARRQAEAARRLRALCARPS